MNSFIWRKKNITGGSADTSNLVTTNTSQTISGAKTFSTSIVANGGIQSTNGDLSLNSNANINCNSKKLINVANPTANTDAANKQYVDSVSGNISWTKIGFINSSIVQPNQTANPQVIDFTNYELTNGIFSFSLKIGINNHDLTCSISNLQITNNNDYSVCSNIITIKSPNDNDKFFDLMIERTTNHQIKLWFYNLKNSGFTISYWGVLVKRESDLVTYN